MSSSRLPGKSLMKIGDKPLIWYVVKRLEQLEIPIIVATSKDPSDDKLAKYLKEEDFLFYRGSLNNVLQRYIDAAEAFNLEKIVRVTGDNPLTDVVRLKDSLKLFKKYNYVDGIYLKEGLIKGTGFELINLNELRKIEPKTNQHKEHVTLWLRQCLQKSHKRIRLKPDKNNLFRKDIILTCDFPEDFKLLSKIFDHFNYRYDMTISEIRIFLDNNPNLKLLNQQFH